MLIIQKYGGTSVANIERIKAVAAHVIATVHAGHKVVVVVSAMAGETDRLLKLGNACHSEPELVEGEESPTQHASFGRELDALISTGEQVSAALTAAAINSLGVSAVSLTAPQVRIVTDSQFQHARIQYIETNRIQSELAKGRVVVITGFQGVDDEGNITTIGRGGSDTSAVAIAAALHADWCEIYTDVNGVFSADPNICPGAKKIEKVSYEELLETAGAGAKVVHMHAVELAAKHNVNCKIKISPSIIPPHPPLEKGGISLPPPLKKGGWGGFGTHVTREEINMAEVLVSTVTHTANEAKLTLRRIPNKVGLAARLFEPLAKANINVDMIVQNVATDGTFDISFTVAKQDLKRAMQLTEIASREMNAGKTETAGDVAKVSIVGIGMRSHAGIAAKMFETLAREGIDIQMISTSEIKVSVVVDMKQMQKAVNALHEAFIT